MKSLTFVTLLLLLLSGGLAKAQIGDAFPQIAGETVLGDRVTIPKDTQGKYSLVGLAYSKKSEDDLNTWFNPVNAAFLRNKESAGLFASFAFDINVYFIPMFTGIKAAGKKPAMKKATNKIDPTLQPHILFYAGKLKPYKEALDFEKKDIPYIFLLDASGTIVYATSGRFTQKKMDTIESMIE